MRYICLKHCKVYHPCHSFQICFNIRFSNFHYILCRNNLDNKYRRKFELKRHWACHPWSTIRVLSNCIIFLRSLSKSKHIELLQFVHILHHNFLLFIATKKSRFIWFFSYEYVLYTYTKYYWFPLLYICTKYYWFPLH